MFRRRRRDEEPAEADPQAIDEVQEAATGDEPDLEEAPTGRADVRPAPAERADGPWDVTEVDDPAAGGRVDLGGMWLPGRPGLEVRVEADQATSQVVAVTLVLGSSALQLQPFAAPRSEDIWDEVRGEIAAGITKQGGTADTVDGPLGPELRTKVPVRAADGTQGVQPARFVGVGGPRWFLRGVITGQAAVEDGVDDELVALFREVVVVGGAEPMAPRDPIPLRLPPAASADDLGDGDDGDGDDDGADDSADDSGGSRGRSDDLKPFERGPEITEIR